MTLFDRVKQSVSPREAAERCGLPIDRHDRCCCPFHGDTHPSMKLNADYFYCFACHASGDSIRLAAQLMGVSQWEAARRLASDFRVSEDAPRPRAVSPAQRERDARKELSHFLVHLRAIKMERAPIVPDEDFDQRFIRACQLEETVYALYDMLRSNMQDEREEAMRHYQTDPMIRETRSLVDTYMKQGGLNRAI